MSHPALAVEVVEDPAADWVLLQCAAAQEARVAAALRTILGVPTYLPLWPERCWRQGRWQTRQRAFLPGYLFAQGLDPVAAATLAAVPGHPRFGGLGAANRLLLTPEGRQGIEQTIVDTLATPAATPAPFPLGAEVRIIAGPFVAQAAFYLGMGRAARAAVLLGLAGRLTVAEIDLAGLAFVRWTPAHADLPRRWGHSHRHGKGRPAAA